jgi:Kef-type K+ transport system membrane component KefB
MNDHGLVEVLVLLGAGIVGVGLARTARLSPLIGYFISGSLVGPHVLGWVQESDSVHALAEAGIAFFLFEVGLFLPLKRLVSAWRELFILGPLQVVFCTLGLLVIGRMVGLDWRTAALAGAILSLSSTAVVLRLLQEHGEVTTPVGQRIASILVFQDLVAVVLLALVAAFGKSGAGIGAIFTTLGAMVVGLVAVIGLGRWLLQPFIGWVMRLDAGEVVTGAALFAVLALSWLGTKAGLSIPLGAFLAGVCLAESRYGYVVQTEVAPFRMLLLSLFFLTVGLGLDPMLLLTDLPRLLGITVGIMLAKFLFTTLSQRMAGVPLSPAVRAGAVLAQGSEFAFIVATSAMTAGLLGGETAKTITAAVTLTLAFTPLAAWAGCAASRRLAREHAEAEQSERKDGEVIIVEFDEVAWELAAILTRANVRYRGHDRDWSRILLARSRGFDVHYSDPDRPRTLSRAAVGMVRGVVILVEDQGIVDQLLTGFRSMQAQFPILAATRDLAFFERLNGESLTAVFIKNHESPRQLAMSLLRALEIPSEVIDRALVVTAEQQPARAA